MAIRIDNRAESAAGGAWSGVNLTALRNRLARAVEEAEAGARPAVREVYAVVDGFDAPSRDWGYPHHVMRGDTVVLHVGGVQAATQRSRQQNAAGAMAHLRAHARALLQAGKMESSVLVED